MVDGHADTMLVCPAGPDQDLASRCSARHGPAHPGSNLVWHHGEQQSDLVVQK